MEEVDLSNICANTIYTRYFEKYRYVFFDDDCTDVIFETTMIDIDHHINEDTYDILRRIPPTYEFSHLDITELIYFTAFNTLHIANKLKRERIRLKEHFRKHIKNIIECLPGGKVYQECESRFNQLQDELNK